ncbi:MAG TPA: hypothetical protein VKT76_10315 [Bradyrhizobium sp.]|nr:hypothetical protein [Bradyrhizobium sp.]
MRVTSDDLQNFAGRFEKWASSPAGALGNVGAPASQPTPNPGKRSDIPDNVTPTSARPTPSVWPFLAADASGFGGVSKYAAPNGSEAGLPPPDPDAPGLPLSGSAGDDNVPERRLVGRVVNLSAPASSGAPPLVPNQAASTSPLLGLFSGQPMPDWPVPPPIFQTKDQSPPEDNELWQRWRAFIGD